MTTKAFQKIYTKISQITKATCSLKAQGVGYDELAIIDGRLAQVVKIVGDDVTLQVFQGTGGIPTNAEVVFMGKAPTLFVDDNTIHILVFTIFKVVLIAQVNQNIIECLFFKCESQLSEALTIGLHTLKYLHGLFRCPFQYVVGCMFLGCSSLLL